MTDITIFILPVSNFSKENFTRIHDTILYRWDTTIIYMTLLENCDFYQKNFPEFNVQTLHKNYINNSFLDTLKSQYGEINRFILMKDSYDNNPPIEWEATINTSFYRDFVAGYGGLRLVGNQNIKKDFPLFDKHIFSKIASLSDGYVYFPYGTLSYRNFFGDVNEMGFRVPPSYQNLKNRQENHKLICICGGSAAFSLYSNKEESFANKLELLLNSYSTEENTPTKFTVLNFSAPAYFILNQINTYILFIDELNPDIVISHDGFNDLGNGEKADSFLQKTYDINYLKELEKFGERVSENSNYEKPKNPLQTNASIVTKAYYKRKKQFEKLVTNNGGKFISGFQPILQSKKRIAPKEEYLNTISGASGLFKNILLMYERYLSYENKFGGFEHNINFHKLFKQYDQNNVLFGDICHQIDQGEDIIANEYFKLIKKEFMKE